MKRILTVFMLLLFGFSELQAQSEIQESVEIMQMIEQADKLGEYDIAKAFKLFTTAKDKARKNGNKQLLAKALYAESYYFFYDTNYEKAIGDLQEAAKIYSSLNLMSDEAKCYSREGVSWMNLNQYSKALRLLFKSKELAEKIGDKKIVASVNNNIGLVYESLNDWDNALVYAKKSLADKIARNDTLGLVMTYGNIANLYYYNKNYDLSLANFKLSDKYCKLSNNPYQQAILYSDLGNLLNEMGQPDSAIYYQNQAMQFHAQLKDERIVEWCHTVSSLGRAWLKKEDLKKAAFYIAECEICEESISDLSFLKGLYSLRAEYYTKTKNYIQASQNLQLLNAVNDSILTKSDRFENQRIAILYEFEQKAKEDSLRFELKVSKQEIATSSYKNKIYLLLVTLLVVALVAVGIIQTVRKKMENKRKQELETMRNNIAGDLHDDIGSTLSSIQIISSMMVTQRSDDQKMKEAAGNISRLSDKVADGIREIVWSVNPAHDNLEAIVEHLRKLAAETLDASSIPFTFCKEIEDSQTKLLPRIRKDFMMLYKEAINNARKYSGTQKIDIRIVQKKTYLEMQVKDYGCGFDLDKIKRGSGLTNMERRAKNMNADLSIISKIGTGTEIDLKIPLS